VVVEDTTGVGINPTERAAPTEDGGYGLSIAEHIDLLSGKTEVEADRRRGARVNLSVRMEPDEKAGQSAG
jgi:hypothetical protein